MMDIKILVADDEQPMRDLIRFYLEKEGVKISEAKDGAEALSQFDQTEFQLVILDVMMPKVDGWAVAKKIREHSQVPIIMLTARTELKDKIYGFEQGADDYITKPFEIEELLVRIHALLRRAKPSNSPEKSEVYKIPDAKIDETSRICTILDQPVNMTKKEFDLLLLFVKNSTRIFSREKLLELVWGEDFFGDDRTVDQHIKNIREKFRSRGSAHNPIQTVWGLGYKLKE